MPVSGTFFDEHNSYVGMTVTVQTQRLDEGHNFVSRSADTQDRSNHSFTWVRKISTTPRTHITSNAASASVVECARVKHVMTHAVARNRDITMSKPKRKDDDP